MNTKRELLELAARAMQAAGDVNFCNYSSPIGDTGICLELGARPGAITSYWDPLTNSSDGAWMEEVLLIGLTFWPMGVCAGDPYEGTYEAYKDFGGHRGPARRMAALREAAAIGRLIKERT